MPGSRSAGLYESFRIQYSRVAERKGKGLQNLLRWFESTRGVNRSRELELPV